MQRRSLYVDKIYRAAITIGFYMYVGNIWSRYRYKYICMWAISGGRPASPTHTGARIRELEEELVGKGERPPQNILVQILPTYIYLSELRSLTSKLSFVEDSCSVCIYVHRNLFYVHVEEICYMCVYILPAVCMNHITHYNESCCGVATICRLLKIIGLFCRIQSLLQGSFVKETYSYKEPTNPSHPMWIMLRNCLWYT